MKWYEPFLSALRIGNYLAAHVVVALLLIGTIEIVQRLLIVIGDPKLFDTVPIRYLFDAMDLGILAIFIMFAIRLAHRTFKGDDHA